MDDMTATRLCADAECDGERHCSDYANDCKHVPDPLACWIGGTRIHMGEVFYTPIADGYCPMLRAAMQRAKGAG